MHYLYLGTNQLTGTAALLILSGVVVYHCKHVVVVVIVVVAVQAVLQVAWSVAVHAKVCTDALSVSYPLGAQVERSSRCS